MKIGFPSENRRNETRIIIQLAEIKTITSAGHEVWIEKGAGLGLGITDGEFEQCGAKLGNRDQVYGCELVVRIKEPNKKELSLMRPGSIIMTMMHLRCSPDLEANIKKYKVIPIPLENLKNVFGVRVVEAVKASGRIGMEYAFKLWGKDPAQAQVKIMGYGNIAVGAIRCAARKRARVEILNRTHFTEMEKHLPGTDILVDAVNRPFRRSVEREIPFVTRKMLKLLKPGSVIVDLISTPKGHAPVETMHPTTLDDLYYKVDGIYHTSCWGWPGLEPDTVAKRYSLQITPIILDIANNGLDKASKSVKQAINSTKNLAI